MLDVTSPDHVTCPSWVVTGRAVKGFLSISVLSNGNIEVHQECGFGDKMLLKAIDVGRRVKQETAQGDDFDSLTAEEEGVNAQSQSELPVLDSVTGELNHRRLHHDNHHTDAPPALPADRNKPATKLCHVRINLIKEEEDTARSDEQDDYTEQFDEQAFAEHVTYNDADDDDNDDVNDYFDDVSNVAIDADDTEALDMSEITLIEDQFGKTQCPLCFKHVTQKSFRGHMITMHDAVSKFRCEVCGKKLATQASLKAHMSSSHGTEKKYECPQCGKAFKRKIQLNYHMDTHAGEAKYPCNQCDRTFTTRPHLYKHRTDDHGSKYNRCYYCDVYLSTKEELDEHINRVHIFGENEAEENINIKTEINYNDDVTGNNDVTGGVTEITNQGKVLKVLLEDIFAPMKDDGRLLNSIIGGDTEHVIKTENNDVSKTITEEEKGSMGDGGGQIAAGKSPKRSTTTTTTAAGAVVPSVPSDLPPVQLTGSQVQCTLCGRVLANRERLYAHNTRVHRRHSKHNCRLCGQKCFTFSELRKHVAKHSEARPFSCDICHKTFKYKVNITHHKCIDTEDKKYKCSVCGMAFRQRYELTKHRDYVHRGKRRGDYVQCSVCSIVMKPGSIKLHMINRHGNGGKYKCKVCGKGWALPSQLRKHMITHEKNKPFKCAECGRQFKTERYLEFHMRNYHAKPRPFKIGPQCHFCGKTFSCDKTLQKHRQDEHNERRDIFFPCMTCGKIFLDNHSLLNHMTVAGCMEKAVQDTFAEIAEKEAAYAAELQQQQAEEEVSEFSQYKLVRDEHGNTSCPLCHKQIKRRTFKSHLVSIHDVASRYQCDKCGKNFHSRHSLNLHNDVHTTERPYQCEHCGKSFKRQALLRDHMDCHSEVAKYQCDQCGPNSEKYKTRQQLYHHRNKVHGTKYNKCYYCGIYLSSHEEVNKHVKEVHMQLENVKSESGGSSEQTLQPAAGGTPADKDAGTSQQTFEVVQFVRDANGEIHVEGTITENADSATIEPSEANAGSDSGNATTGAGPNPLAVAEATTENFTPCGRKLHLCTLCGKSFSGSDGLREHSARVHLKVAKFMCDLCGQKCFSKSDYSKHIAKHSDARPFQCELCSKDFKYKANLVGHMNVHIQQESLQKYMLNHPELPRYECKECDMIFPNSRNLLAHMTFHDPSKLLKCDRCDKTFAHKRALKVHRKTHPKGNICSVCGKGFNSRGSMMRHKQSIHDGILKFKCDVCEKRFVSRSHLTRHLRTHGIYVQKSEEGEGQTVADQSASSGAKKGKKRVQVVSTAVPTIGDQVVDHVMEAQEGPMTDVVAFVITDPSFQM